jgi:hypothetical protein
MRIGLVASVILLTACSYQEVLQSAQYSKKTYISEKPVGIDTTVTWNSDQRVGAAYKSEAYTHVLGQQNASDIVDIPPTSTSSVERFQNPSNAIKNAVNNGYSIYELQRWERFCGKGKMNAKDWDFIAIEGRHNLPEHLKPACTPPSFSRNDYLHAWQRFCSTGAISREDAFVINHTDSPHEECKE